MKDAVQGFGIGELASKEKAETTLRAPGASGRDD